MRHSDWKLLVQATRAERDYCKWRAWKTVAGDDIDDWTYQVERLDAKLEHLRNMKRENGVQGDAL